jgi:hypothetical protein
MYETLHYEPFFLINKDDVLFLAQYLAEDNTEDFFILDEHHSNDILVINDVFFKHFVNKYQSYTPERRGCASRYEIAEIIFKFTN